MPPRRVVCTGIGMVSPLGLGARECWTALLNSRVGVQRLREEHSFEGCKSRVAAYVPEVQLEEEIRSQKHEFMVKNSKQLSRATTFAMLAAHEAFEDAHMLDESGQRVAERFQSRCGVAMGQGMVDFNDIFENASLISDSKSGQNGFRKLSPFFMTRVLMNMSAGNISIRYKLHGPNHCVSTACATGAHSIGDAFKMIKDDKADIMLCGGTEAAINKLSVAGFERLKALCTKFNDTPAAASRPFDKNRSGFVIGEGAGALVLEDLDHAISRGLDQRSIYAEILGYGMSADAHHLTSPLPNGGGATRSMLAAIKDAGIQPHEVSHINAHATSTPLGDDIECNAIENVFKDSPKITVTSCKGSIGHLLGGAGSVESIFAMLSCRDAVQPNCVNLDEPLETNGFQIDFVRQNPSPWTLRDRILVKNSFGFGGTNASLVLRNYSG